MTLPTEIYIMMKRFFLFVITLLQFSVSVDAQLRVVDATDGLPVSAASVLDAAGNMVGFTMSDGSLTEIPKSSYPITVRSVGYEQIVIEFPKKGTLGLVPVVYELEELIVVPVERNILKQKFYVREYFSINNVSDTVTYFFEHMAHRFIPAVKGVRFFGGSSIRTLASRGYSRFKVLDIDSVAAESESKLTSLLSVADVNDEPILAPESFKGQGDEAKLYEKTGKEGVSLIQKQNAYTFTSIEDKLAEKKGHSISVWPLKLLGLTMKVEQLYTTHAYRVNDEGVYMPKDLIECGMVMEAEGSGRLIRKIFKSDDPVEIRSMIEIYLVDSDYLTKDEAKAELKNGDANVEFVIPSSIPPLNKATRSLVERVKAKE